MERRGNERIGLFHLVLSLIPPSLLKIFNMLGFEGNRYIGLSSLRTVCKLNADYRSLLSSVVLLSYNLVLRPAFSREQHYIDSGFVLLCSNPPLHLYDTEEGLQESTDLLVKYAGYAGLKINAKKTKVVAFSKGLSQRPFSEADTVSISVEGNPVEQVSSFTYLGSALSSDGTIDKELGIRIGKAYSAFSMLCRIWYNRNIRTCTKSRIYRAAVLTVLLYGCLFHLVLSLIPPSLLKIFNMLGFEGNRYIGLSSLRTVCKLNADYRSLLSSVVLLSYNLVLRPAFSREQHYIDLGFVLLCSNPPLHFSDMGVTYYIESDPSACYYILLDQYASVYQLDELGGDEIPNSPFEFMHPHIRYDDKQLYL
eukprot:sb/3465895/